VSEGPLPNFAVAGLVISHSITVPDSSTVTDDFVPFSEAPTTNEQPETPSGTTINTTVVIVTAVVGICVGLLGAFGVYLWRRRKNRDGTSKLSKNVEDGRTALFQSAGVPNGEFVSMFLHHQAEVMP
jgi:LPXTG-motif cell wall-anchored protein